MKKELTKTQEKIYSYILGFIDDNGYSPTYNEISERFNVTIQAIDAQIKNLVAKDKLRFNGKKFRKIDIA